MGAVITLLWLLVLLHIARTDAACSVNTTDLDLAADNGTFVSHEGYGSVDYENKQNCEWLITVSTGWVVRLTMEDFELQKTSDCRYDRVTIYDGSNTSDPLIGKYCGTYDSFPNIPNSSSNQILVVFITSILGTYKGFQCSWVRSMPMVVTFSEYRYTGKLVEGRTGSSSVTFCVPPHAEGGAGRIAYSLVGSLASKLSIDSNTAALRLSGETHIHCYLGDPDDLVQTDELGIRATNADGDFATVPLRVKLYATAASALVGSLIVTAPDLDSLMKVKLDSGEIRFIPGTEGPFPRIVGLDSMENWLYWGDFYTEALMRIQVTDQGAEAKTFFQLQDGAYPYGLSVNSENRTLYYADSRYYIIGSVDMSSKKNTVLLQLEPGSRPTSVVLDDSREYLYFTDEGDNPSVSRLSLIDGVTKVLDDSVGWPRGLAINNTIGRLYVCDSTKGKIIQLNVNGSGRSTLNDSVDCLAVALENNVLYVSSYSGNQITVLYADTGAVLRVYDTAGLGSIYGIAISPGASPEPVTEKPTTLEPTTDEPTTLKPRPDPCTVNRGGCEQYCTSQGDEVTCVCSDSFVLSSTDNKTCNDPCAADNGGCSQLCSVDSHQVVCKCQDGYNVDHDDRTKCMEVDECEVVRCANGGSCKDLVNMFICSCTTAWAGRYCKQEVSFEPVVENMSPLKGPVAGQSRLTLTGDHFVDGVLVRLGDELVCSYHNSDGTSAVVLTPPVNESYSNKQLPVYVHFPGFTRKATLFMFTYKGNPTLSSVKPLESHTLGGTRLTVVGQDLDVVSDPVLKITMVHTYTEGGNTMENVTIYNSSCKVDSSTEMYCLTPTVQIPDSFKNWDQNQTNRKRRSSDSVHFAGRRNGENKRYPRAVQQELDLTITTANESLAFYISFKLDGLTTPRNEKLTIFSVPITVEMSEFEIFVPYTDMKIHMRGARFLNGFEASDYKVAIGGGWCNDIDMTANEIICAPPDELPAETTGGEEKNAPVEKQDVDLPKSRRKRSIRKVQVDVVIHAGTELKIYAGELTYHITEQNLTVILASVFAAVAVIVIAAVIVGCCVYRRKKAAHGPEMHGMSSAGPSGRPSAPNEDDGETDYETPAAQADILGYETPISQSDVPEYKTPISQSDVLDYTTPISPSEVNYETPISQSDVPEYKTAISPSDALDYKTPTSQADGYMNLQCP